MESPSGGMPEKAPRWDLTRTEGSAVEKCLRGCLWWFGNICEYIGGRTRSGGSGGAHKVGGAPPRAHPPPLSPPHGSSDLNSKSPGCLLVQEKSPRMFYSIWNPFGIPFL